MPFQRAGIAGNRYGRSSEHGPGGTDGERVIELREAGSTVSCWRIIPVNECLIGYIPVTMKPPVDMYAGGKLGGTT
ncbi:hypothetical protein M3661_05745 [Paenibacillus sp. MER 180]|uniref:hypothetical protein n=1 Tax=Paenibacillus sp. MER 180 TaxID=2939570 RepID=UPI00203CDF37|nr:hypothetical protein [Paenibacillus sp. MER 180]MCM3289629.1 hypothetical protein [Paenibacillus sp. MER 180]